MRSNHQNGDTSHGDAILASEISYRRLFEAAQDGILILDVETGRIDDVNPFLLNLLDFPRSEMVGKTVGELSPFKDIESNQAMLERLQQHGYVRYEDLPLETRTGRRIAVEFVSNVYQAGSKKVIQCNIRDITERKKLERRADRLNEEARIIADRSNLIKSEFLANASHEIRTPMAAVIGLANILAASQPLTQEQKGDVHALQTSAASLLDLINDLLDVSKLESNSVVLDEIRFSLSKLMGELINMISGIAREKRLSFSIDDQAVRGLYFIGDPKRLRQILLNLCGNAIKFTGKGSIRVRVELKPIDDTKVTLTISVTDTGIGISEDKLSSVFDRFAQADVSISRLYGGTGLGLTISKTLVELMGGTIRVDSVLGKGSTFTVSIPLQLSSSNWPSQEEGNGGSSPSKITVLLVEDHEPNIFVESNYLETLGMECEVARNGMEAMALFALRKYALILLDVQIPSIDGFEVARRIRTWETTAGSIRTPIIGMTAHAFAKDRERCLEAGMDEYISKPFDPEELRGKVLSFVKTGQAK